MTRRDQAPLPCQSRTRKLVWHLLSCLSPLTPGYALRLGGPRHTRWGPLLQKTHLSLNLRQIEIFRAVMITGSIAGAAQLLRISAPAVSRLLSHTESRIGFALFERIKGRLYATPEAKKLFREVELVYAGVQRVNQLAHDLSESTEGIVNIVASPSVAQMLIPQAITATMIRIVNEMSRATEMVGSGCQRIRTA